jgi:hypothetical protein
LRPPADFKSLASANFATRAGLWNQLVNRI